MTNCGPSSDAHRSDHATQAEATRRCPICQRDVPRKAMPCPQCGFWDRPPSLLERHSKVIDPIAGVLMLLVAVLVSVPSTMTFVDAVRDGRHLAGRIAFATMWNLALWGFPVAFLIYNWRQNILCHRPATEGLWRIYYRTQFVALLLLILFATCFLVLLG
jgi:hypothetical protein